MTSNPTLEDRLRMHYLAKADELRLPPMEFEDLLHDGQPVTILATHAAPPRRRTALLAAAAILLVAIVGAGALIRSRSSDPTATTPATTPRVPAPCPTAAHAARSSTGAAAVVAAPTTVLLPVAAPPGYCAKTISTTNVDAPQRYTVWSSCTGCAAPTGSVALVRHGDNPGTTETPEREHQDLSIKGRDARYYPASAESPLAELISRDGIEPGFAFYGWGLDHQTMVDLATSLIDGTEVPSHDGLQLVFDGQFGAVVPGLAPADTTVDIEYTTADQSSTFSYIYQHGQNATANLDSLAWTLPNATFTTVNGQPALVSAYGQHATIVVQHDEHTLVILGSTGPATSAQTINDLSAIQLTVATPTDPRWEQLNLQTAGR